MHTERLKGWLSSSSKMVAASAQLAKKQAELTTLNSVTLPRLYHAIGKRLVGSPNLPPDLVPHREKIRELEAAIATKPEEPKSEPASGFAAKAKQLAQQAASKTAKATADAAATVKIQAAYVTLGKQAIEKYGPKALPQDLREQYDSAMHKQADLTGELTALKGTSGNRLVTPGRLAVIGSVACLLLGLWTLRGITGWLFPSPSYIPVAVTSHRDHAVAQTQPSDEQTSATDSDDDESSTIEPGIATPANDSERVGNTDPAVAAIIGDTSIHYTMFGYKDVALGQTYEQIDATHPIRFAKPGGYAFVEKPTSPHTFFFDADGRLVCYQMTYKGGPDDYLEELTQVFGKTDKRPNERSSRGSEGGSPFAADASIVRYTFPRTLIFVAFQTKRTLVSSTEETSVTVLDRRYVEDLLSESAASRRQVIGWMATTAQRLKSKDFSGDQVPPLEGCRIDPFETKIAKGAYVIDTTHGKDFPTHGVGVDGKKGCVGRASVSLVDWPDQKNVVYFNFRFYRPAVVDRCLMQSESQRRPPQPPHAIHCLPFVGQLESEMTSLILQGQLPPDGKTLEVVQRGQGGYMSDAGTYEWQHHDTDGSKWSVQCGEQDDIRLIYEPPKRL